MFLTESIESNEKGGGGGGSLAEILVEAEVSYGNLVQRMMILEHKAIITEDAKLLQESVRGFWETFVAWVKKWVAKVKDFFMNLWNRIAGIFQKDKAWIASIKKKGLKLGKVEGIKIHSKVKTGAINTDGLSRLGALLATDEPTAADASPDGANASVKAELLTKLGSTDKDASVHDAMVDFVLGEGGTSEEDITDSHAFLGHLEALIGITDKSRGETLKTLNEAVKKAEKTAAAQKGESGDQRKASIIRSKLSLVSAGISAFSSAIGTARSEMRSIINAGISSGRKDSTKDIHGESALFEGVL